MNYETQMDSEALTAPRAALRVLGSTGLISCGVAAMTPEESERATQRAASLAGFLTPMLFYLALAIRAHHVVFRARGVDPGAYLVPLPVNLRVKGREGAIFRTRVSLLWFYVAPALAENLPALLEELKLQRREAIRSGQIENGASSKGLGGRQR